MISKNRIKLIRSLQLKKYRQKYNKFVCEGGKIGMEVLRDAPNKIDSIYGTTEFARNVPEQFRNRVEVITKVDLKSMSSLEANNDCLVVCDIPSIDPVPNPPGHLSFYLDSVRDPGNLGTIIRLCDWFGMPNLFVSEGCVDHYNSKVIQASMGSILRVKIIKESFESTLDRFEENNVAIADMNGHDYRTTVLDAPALIILGNESNGVSQEIRSFIHQSITIPGASEKVESLNVAVSASILAAQYSK